MCRAIFCMPGTPLTPVLIGSLAICWVVGVQNRGQTQVLGVPSVQQVTGSTQQVTCPRWDPSRQTRTASWSRTAAADSRGSGAELHISALKTGASVSSQPYFILLPVSQRPIGIGEKPQTPPFQSPGAFGLFETRRVRIFHDLTFCDLLDSKTRSSQTTAKG